MHSSAPYDIHFARKICMVSVSESLLGLEMKRAFEERRCCRENWRLLWRYPDLRRVDD
jgi:hypothetical protein